MFAQGISVKSGARANGEAGVLKAVIRKRDMNRTEAAYSQELELRRRVGEILDYKFERITLKLADDTRFTPDFFVIMADLTIEFHETKGWMRDDAAVKLKVAADQFPFKFRLVKWINKQWQITEI